MAIYFSFLQDYMWTEYLKSKLMNYVVSVHKLIILGVNNGGGASFSFFWLIKEITLNPTKWEITTRSKPKLNKYKAQKIFEDVKHLDSQEIAHKTWGEFFYFSLSTTGIVQFSVSKFCEERK